MNARDRHRADQPATFQATAVYCHAAGRWRRALRRHSPTSVRLAHPGHRGAHIGEGTGGQFRGAASTAARSTASFARCRH